MAKIRFGQYVRLTVESRDNTPVFETDSLRVDFDIRDIAGWQRAKIDIYNLSPETNKLLINGENYVTITTSLHGGKEVILAKHLYVSNASNEFSLPNSITKLYCYSSLKRTHLEKQISIEVTQPSLKKCMDEIMHSVYYGKEVNVIYKQFPDNYVEALPENPLAKFEGSVISCVDLLGKQYRFQQFIDGTDLVIMYQVTPKNQSATSLEKEDGTVKLSTDNMRSNPKLGPSTIEIHSNLDARIKPAAVIDIANILTAGTTTPDKQLETAKNLLKNSVANFRKYQVYKVQHKGSNFTGEWSTHASGVAPTQGFTMSNNDYSWFK